MTREHLYFIPIVFSLGVVLGSQVTRQRMMAFAPSKPHVTGRGLLVPLFAFLTLFLLTHAVPLHGGANAVQDALGGEAIFDQRASFSTDEVYSRLAAFGVEGRTAYQHMTHTTDVVFPLALFAFLIQLARFVTERAAAGPTLNLLALLLPALWLGTDFAENAVVFQLLSGYPTRHDTLAWLLGSLTSAKFGLLLSAIATTALISLLAARRATPIPAADVQSGALER